MRYTQTILLLLFAWLISSAVHAQVFPVQATTQLNPPYSLYLSDYVAPGSDRLALNVFLGDIARPELQVKFKLRIIGQGITIETKPEYNPPPVSLQGGIPLRLISSDLADYFNPANLNFQGITRRQVEQQGKLPEGVYQICFEVYEYNRNLKISNTSCGVAWMILNDPPIINTPRQNEKLKTYSPQNVVFQWTPRHTGSPNSAFTTEYEFRMVEVWPETRNPNDAILTSPPIFETTIQNTLLVYGPAETPLEPGRRYAFRVRAKSIAGVDELDLFKNQGYSEVFTFVYGDACDLPTGISVDPGSTRLNLAWDGQFNHTAYKVRYRKAGTTEWYTNNYTFNEATITSLKPATLYEYQIAGTCGWYQGGYTDVATFKTKEAPAVEYSCGIPLGTFNLDASLLAPSINTGDIIQTGDFDVQVSRISGGSGTFSGEGVVVIPMMNKVKVKAEFSNIKVAEDSSGFRMVEGFMNVTGGGVDIVPEGVMDFMEELEEGLDLVDSALNVLEDFIPTPGPDPESFAADTLIQIDGTVLAVVREESTGKVTITTTTGQTVELPPGENYAIKDNKGKGYVVDSQGNTTKTTAEKAVKASKREYNLSMLFVKDTQTKYGLDEKKIDALAHNYEKIGTDYLVPWKAVDTKSPDVVKGILGDNSIDVSRINFVKNSQALQTAPPVNREWQLNQLQGVSAGETESIVAYYTPADTSEKEQILGKVNLTAYDKIVNKLVIVPVNGNVYPYNAGNLTTQLNNIFRQAVAGWEVTIDNSDLQVALGEQFDDGATGLLSNYTEDMKKVITAFKSKMQSNTFYLFLVKNPKGGSSGIMPRSKQAGFIFVDKHSTESQIIITIAHELGHGAFHLDHIFSEHTALSAGATQNLMDQNNSSGSDLMKFQWDKIHNPELVVGLFEDDEQAKNYTVVVDRKFINKDNRSLSFLAPTGGVISLPADSLNMVQFTYGALKALNQDPGNGVDYDFDLFSGYLYKFSLKRDNHYFIYVFDHASRTYKAEHNGEVFNDTFNYELVDGFVYPIGCAAEYNLYKFEKGALPKFVNGSGTSKRFAEMAAEFKPFHEVFPLKSSAGVVLKQVISDLIKDDCGWCLQENTVKMTASHCEKPELFYIDKIAQLRAVFPEYFSAFTQDRDGENWEYPTDRIFTSGGGIAGASVSNTQTVPYDSWPWGKYLKEHPELKIAYTQKSDLRDYFITFCYQFRDYVDESMNSSTLFWDRLTESTTPIEIIQHLRSEPNYVTQQVQFAKRQIAIKTLAQGKIAEPKENAIIKLLSCIKPLESGAALDVVVSDVGFKQVFDEFHDWGGEDNFSRVVTLISSYIDNPQPNIEAFEKALLPDPQIVNIDVDMFDNRQTDGFYFDDDNKIHFYNTVTLPREPGQHPRSPSRTADQEFLVVSYDETIPVQFWTDFEVLGRTFKRKDVIDIPAVYAALLIDKGNTELFEKKIWLLADGVMLVVGVGEIKVLFTAASWIRKLVITADLIGGVSGLVTEAVPESILSAETKRRLRVVNLALGAPQLLRSLKTGVDALVMDLKGARNAAGVTPEVQKNIDDFIKRIEGQLGATAVVAGKSLIKYEIGTGKIIFNGIEIGSVKNGVLTFQEGIDAAGTNADELLELTGVNKILEDGLEYEASNVRIISKNSKWVCEAEGNYCFISGTPVLMEDGFAPIESIKEHAKVAAFDHCAETNVYSKVTKTFRKTVNRLAKIVVGGSLIFSTVDHPFYANAHYIPARDLQIGDSVLTYDGGKRAIESVILIDTTAVVYNLEVEYQHNYYVGAGRLLVHNSCALKTIYSQLTDQTARNAFKSQLRNIGGTIEQRKALIEKIGSLTQAEMNNFLADFNSAAKDFASVFLTNPRGIDAWDIFKRSLQEYSNSATDIADLAKDLARYDAEFGSLIKNNKRALMLWDVARKDVRAVASEWDDFTDAERAIFQPLLKHEKFVQEVVPLFNKGKGFETVLRSDITNSASNLWQKLKAELKIKFEDYEVFEQVQLKTGNFLDEEGKIVSDASKGREEYFIADFVLVKKKQVLGVTVLDYDNAIVIESKLSEATALTSRQRNGLDKVKSGKTLAVRSDGASNLKDPEQLSANDFTLENSKNAKVSTWVKVWSDGNGGSFDNLKKLY